VLLSMRRFPDWHLESQPLTTDFLLAQEAVLIVPDPLAYEWPWIVAKGSTKPAQPPWH
jgi:hypothetical protein